MTETYRLADLTVEVSSLFSDVHDLCQAYRASGEPDIVVAISEQDIAQERERSLRQDAAEGVPPRMSSDGYLETLAVYRKIAERLPSYDTFLFHGSCVAVDGAAYLFAAPSGTGKSTHTRLWRELLGAKAIMVNDDKPLIHVGTDGTALIFGTPWDGKHRLSSNLSVPLKAICVLERAEQNSIRRITKLEALPMFIQQTYRPADPVALTQTLELLDRLDVQLYRLSCNMDPAAAELSYNTMRG